MPAQMRQLTIASEPVAENPFTHCGVAVEGTRDCCARSTGNGVPSGTIQIACGGSAESIRRGRRRIAPTPDRVGDVEFWSAFLQSCRCCYQLACLLCGASKANRQARQTDGPPQEEQLRESTQTERDDASKDASDTHGCSRSVEARCECGRGDASVAANGRLSHWHYRWKRAAQGDSPMQATPLPAYPLLHARLHLPPAVFSIGIMFVHNAFTSQSSAPVAHSSISVQRQRCGTRCAGDPPAAERRILRIRRASEWKVVQQRSWQRQATNLRTEDPCTIRCLAARRHSSNTRIGRQNRPVSCNLNRGPDSTPSGTRRHSRRSLGCTRSLHSTSRWDRSRSMDAYSKEHRVALRKRRAWLKCW